MADLALVYFEDGYVQAGETMVRYAEAAGAIEFQNRDDAFHKRVLLDELARYVCFGRVLLDNLLSCFRVDARICR